MWLFILCFFILGNKVVEERVFLLLFMFNSVYFEILNILGLSFKNVYRLDLVFGFLWFVLMMKNFFLGFLFDRINLYFKII